MSPSNRFMRAVRQWPRTSTLVLLLILLAGVIVSIVQGQRIALDRLEASLDRSSVSRGNLLQRDLQHPLLVPEILSSSKTVRALLAHPNAIAAHEQNLLFEEIARNTQVDVVYLVDLSGNCLAASNWREGDSFVGKNYGFRPYFRQAVGGKTGSYIAKGVTSSKVGYFLARPVLVNDAIVGVVVVKISFGSLQTRIAEFWQQDKELNLITDENGVVVISPVDAFAFRSIQPLAEDTRKAIVASRQYGGDEIGPIAVTPGKVLTRRLRFVEFAELPGQAFMQKVYVFPDLGIRLYVHLPTSHYWQIVAEFTAMFSLSALVIFLACVSVFQRSVYSASLIEAAMHDPLTGLHTRLYMGDWCDSLVRAHNRDPDAGFGLIVFDLDLFKQVNDKYGHLAGDDVLRRVGRIIRDAIRGGDLAVRFGGEELAVFAHGKALAEVVALAERIRLCVEHTEFYSNGQRIPVTLSGGAAFHAAGESLDALFARADMKLYEAKQSGRNRVLD